MEKILRSINNCLWRFVGILAAICLMIFLVAALIVLGYVAWKELSSLSHVVEQIKGEIDASSQA